MTKVFEGKEGFLNGDLTLDDGTKLLDNLNNEELAALASNTDNEVIKKIAKDRIMTAEEKLTKLRFELKKITMGEFATASEYLSVFAS